jgi:hypothetical protein
MCRPTTNAESTNQDATPSKKEKVEQPPPPVSYNIQFSDFLDPTKPWIMVPNGSFRGNFDWVPLNFRMGPWNIACCAYLTGLCYWIALNALDAFFSRPVPAQEIPVNATNSWQHWYNVMGFLWTTHVAYKVVQSDMSWRAWTSYTLQSWTLIILRHGLSALAPYVPSVAPWNEYLRFPMLIQATVTFVTWNFALMPVILTRMKTSEARTGFLNMCFGFLLTQLHVLNLVLAGINGVWGTAAREFTRQDFAVALLFALQYVLFYLMILDRLGIHYYLIFSPRSPLALVSWSIFVACIYVGFSFWKGVTLQYG